MIRHLAVSSCLIASLARVWVTFVKGSRPIWRTSLTLAMLFMAICAATRYEASHLLDLGWPNIGELLSYGWLILAAGMANVYVDTLSSSSPSWRRSWPHLAFAAACVLTISIAWFETPTVADREASPSINTLPMTPSLATFNIATYGPLVITALRVMIYCWKQLRNGTRSEPGAHLGLSLIGSFSIFGLLSCLSVVIESLYRLPPHAPLHPHSEFLILPPLANAISLSGLGLGVAVLVWAPALDARLHERRLRSDITPLWRFLTLRYPEARSTSLTTTTRKRIEIHDALALHRVAPRNHGWSLDDLADALREEPHPHSKLTADRVLSELSESDLTRDLALVFKEKGS